MATPSCDFCKRRFSGDSGCKRRRGGSRHCAICDRVFIRHPLEYGTLKKRQGVLERLNAGDENERATYDERYNDVKSLLRNGSAGTRTASDSPPGSAAGSSTDTSGTRTASDSPPPTNHKISQNLGVFWPSKLFRERFKSNGVAATEEEEEEEEEEEDEEKEEEEEEEEEEEKEQEQEEEEEEEEEQEEEEEEEEEGG